MRTAGQGRVTPAHPGLFPDRVHDALTNPSFREARGEGAGGQQGLDHRGLAKLGRAAALRCRASHQRGSATDGDGTESRRRTESQVTEQRAG